MRETNRGGRPTTHGVSAYKARKASGKALPAHIQHVEDITREAYQEKVPPGLLEDEFVFTATIPHLLRGYVSDNPDEWRKVLPMHLRFVESMRRLAVAMVPYERERGMENNLSVIMAQQELMGV